MLTEQGGILGALTAGPGCSFHSSHTGRSAGHTSHREGWATCAVCPPKHWPLGQALYLTETGGEKKVVMLLFL